MELKQSDFFLKKNELKPPNIYKSLHFDYWQRNEKIWSSLIWDVFEQEQATEKKVQKGILTNTLQSLPIL